MVVIMFRLVSISHLIGSEGWVFCTSQEIVWEDLRNQPCSSSSGTLDSIQITQFINATQPSVRSGWLLCLMYTVSWRSKRHYGMAIATQAPLQYTIQCRC